MRRKFERLRNNLQEFVRQREHLTMVLDLANESDVAYVLKYLEGIERSSPSDLYLIFGHSCTSPAEYIDSAMAECEMSIELGNAALDEGLGEQGMEHWPGLPGDCFDSSRTPLERIKTLISFIRERLPADEGRIVLAFLPVHVGDPNAYAAAVQELIPFDGFEPWMVGVRILLRDSQQAPRLVPWVREKQAFGTLVYPLDFSTDALNRALLDESMDRSLPMEERMMALYQVAALDHAWNRPQDALLKLGAAYEHYLRVEKDPSMQGLCLLTSAYVLQRQELWAEAEERFRQTLDLALDNEIHQLMLNCFLALAALRQRAEDWAEAEMFWRSAVLIAKYLSNGVAMADALEQNGVCRIALGDTEGALEAWEAGTGFAEKANYWERLTSLLEHLIEIERREGMSAERRAHEERLERARQEALYAEHQRQQALRGEA